MCMKRTNINLNDDDLKAIQIIKQRYGLIHMSDAIRLALRLLAERIDEHPKSN